MADDEAKGGGGIKFGTTQKGKKKLIDENGYYYTLSKRKLIDVRKGGRATEYWKCALSNCPGRFIYYPERRDVIGEGKLTIPHLEEERINPQWRAKEAAMERLKQLTVADKTVKVADLVKKVLKEMPSDARHLMGAEDYLRRKVKFWAKQGDIQIVPSSTEAFLSEGDLSQDDAGPSGSRNETADITQSLRGQDSKHIPEDKNLGLLVLKSRTQDGRFKCMIDGHVFHWYQQGTGGTEYQCWETNNGCPVTATVYEDKQYEVKGEHMHDIAKLKPKQGGRRRKWFSGLQRVDDAGIVLGAVSVNDVGVFKGETSQPPYIPPPPIPEITQESEVASNADDVMDYGDDFHEEFAPETEEPEINETFTDSIKVTKKLSRQKVATKSGERCHVCGDGLLVSETLSTSADTFRKACRYLNIKSDKEWFPDAVNSRFYTFCDSCTKEITKIHDLYKKVEEIQSLIFTKVENVEKRIADAEIVDNWMADAPVSSAVRFESFRKQVLINYKNKLKLRREIRVGRKMGHAFVEVQPGTSANMFASNPAETDAFRKLLPTMSSLHTSIQTRSQSKQKESQHAGNEKDDEVSHSPMDDFSSHEDDGGHHNLEDFQDSCSEASEKETKFWHKDKLLVQQDPTSQGSLKEEHDNMDGDEGDSVFHHTQEEENAQDKNTNEVTSCRGRTLNKRKSTSGRSPSNKTKHSLNSTPKARARSRVMNVEIPDAILTKDDRMFLEGVEILKLPPGSYQQKPESESYSCGTCGIIMLSFWKIRVHICGQHLGMFRCPICDKKFAEPKVIQRHVETQHTERQAKSCEVCLRPMFGDKKSMNYHRWTHLGEDEKNDPKYEHYRPLKVRPLRRSKIAYSFTQSFQCFQCGKTFPRANHLKKHELTHSEVSMKVQCQYCGQFYAHQVSLSSHIKRCPAQENIARRLFACPHCPVRFKDQTGLANHVLRKHGEGKPKPFSCFKCSKQFITKSKHRNHQRVCTGAPKAKKPRKVATSNRRSRSRKHKIPSDSSQPSSSAEVNETHSVDVKIDPSEPQTNQEYSSSNVPSVSGYNYGMPGYHTGMFSHHQ